MCRTFKQVLGANLLVPLTASSVSAANLPFGSGQPCSEIVITNRTGGIIYIFDNAYSGVIHGMLMKNDETMTFRGITNSIVVSASGTAGDIYYRTAFFSMLPQR